MGGSWERAENRRRRASREWRKHRRSLNLVWDAVVHGWRCVSGDRTPLLMVLFDIRRVVALALRIGMHFIVNALDLCDQRPVAAAWNSSRGSQVSQMQCL